MFPPHTLPGGSWHTFILGKLWGAIRGLGEIFSSIFGLLIVGRLVWYLIKVLMNCSYIHSVHGCSAQLACLFAPKFSLQGYIGEIKDQLRKDRTMILAISRIQPYETVYLTSVNYFPRIMITMNPRIRVEEFLFQRVHSDAVNPFLI